MKANTYIGQFLETLEMTAEDGKPVAGLIMSSPGFGKTTAIEKWCQYKDYNLTTLIPSNFTQEDLLGIPVKSSESNTDVIRLNPTWYKEMLDKAQNGKKNVLFIDELSASVEFLQAPLFNLIFKQVFDTKKLPENTIIVSAGNYSEDLNNAFTMTAPMVNRFVILNLTSEDFDVFEAFENDIENINSKEDIEKFLGLKRPKSKTFDFNKFWSWVKNNKSEFTIGKSAFTEDSALGGLLGFISLRSFKFAMTFAQKYMENFDDTIWMRVVGDTLGLSVKREGQPLRLVLEANCVFFGGQSKPHDRTLVEICDDILENGLRNSYLMELDSAINKASYSTTTQQALEKFAEICNRYPTDSSLEYLLKKLTNKMTAKYI